MSLTILRNKATKNLYTNFNVLRCDWDIQMIVNIGLPGLGGLKEPAKHTSVAVAHSRSKGPGHFTACCQGTDIG